MTLAAVPKQHTGLPIDDLVLEHLVALGRFASVPVVEIEWHLPKRLGHFLDLSVTEKLALHLVAQ